MTLGSARPHRPAWLLAVIATVSMMAIAAPAALAHVQIDVGDGQYVMELGFPMSPRMSVSRTRSRSKWRNTPRAARSQWTGWRRH